MKLAIMGSGGVGGYYGARLAHAGHDVAFIARGSHAAAMRQSGLHLKSELGSVQIHPVQVFEHPAAVGTVDFVLVAVKLWDAESAARAIVPLVSESTTVVSLQNGIDKDEILARHVGHSHVLGGSTHINATIEEPGTIVHTGTLQRLVLGELDGSKSARCEAIAAELTAAGVRVEVSRDVRKATWEKFVFLTAHSGLTALTREPIGRVREHPATRTMLISAMREAMQVARAEGVALDEGFVAAQVAFIDQLPPGSMASMAHDLIRGRRLELEWLSGTVIRRAERHAIEVPVHRAIYAGLVLHAGGS